MTKVYRLVPDAIFMMLSSRTGDVREDLLYKLGFIDTHSYDYIGLYKEGTGIVCEDWRKQMFFFRSPWSCIRSMEFLKNYYSGFRGQVNFVARVLEYDIDDDILNNADNAFTNFEYFQAKGKLIDVEQLQENQTSSKEMDEDMTSRLDAIARKDAQETFDLLRMFFDAQTISKAKSYVEKCWPKFMKTRLEHPEKVFSSHIPTGRTMTVTKEDSKLLCSVAFGERPESDLLKLMKKSNGILNADNLQDYDYDSPTHRYSHLYF